MCANVYTTDIIITKCSQNLLFKPLFVLVVYVCKIEVNWFMFSYFIFFLLKLIIFEPALKISLMQFNI